MTNVPDNFAKLYKSIMTEASPDIQKRLCREILNLISNFLDQQTKPVSSTGPQDFSELANWYQELCYTWRRVYHWCDQGDPINAYLWCCMLQTEVTEWGNRFGITDIDILGAYNPGDLPGFRKRAKTVEESFRKAITGNGVIIDEYPTLADFLKLNPVS